MIYMFFIGACVNKSSTVVRPAPIKEDINITAKGLDAYMTYLSIEVARANGGVDDAERLLILKEKRSGI